MICSGCGIIVEEDRDHCPYCGAPVYPLPAYSGSSGEFNPYRALLEKKQQAQKRRNRMIGMILIALGIIFLPIAIITFYEFIGWIFIPIAGICLLAGIVTVATNLSKRATPAYG